MKKIWIFNHYAGGMLFDKGGRHYNFAKYLNRSGYDPVVFSANSRHGSGNCFFEDINLWKEQMAEEISTPFIFVKARKYQGNGKQRVFNMIDFYRNVKKVAKEYAKLHGTPDVILASSVHPLAVAAGIQLAKYFGVKCIAEVRDLWPETIVAYGIAGAKNPAVLALRRLEKWIYTKADAIIFTMEGGKDYIVEQGWDRQTHGGSVDLDKIHHINNGVDLEVFEYNKEHEAFSDADLDDPDTFKVVYTGSIRPANGVGQLLDVAKLLKGGNVRFLIWGAGDQVETIQKQIQEAKLKNIKLKGVVPKADISYILSKSDLNVYILPNNPLYRFGLSLNKSFEYFASGKPVLASSNSGYSIIDRYECGLALDEFTPESMAAAILQFSHLSVDEYEKYCGGARRAAEEYDFKILTQKLIDVVEGIEEKT